MAPPPQGVRIYLYALVQGPAAVATVGTWADGVVSSGELAASAPDSQSLGAFVSFGEATQ